MAKENTPPTRTIAGQKSRITRSTHQFAYDAIHDEIVITSPMAQAILTFRGSANGDEPPLRVIHGPKTGILGGNSDGSADRVSIDPVNNEIMMHTTDGFLVFDRMANGDVAPKRHLRGPDTGLRGLNPAAVDPIRNLLVVNDGARMLIFDRTADGNVKPKKILQGPKTGMGGHAYDPILVYPEKGWVIATCFVGSVCAWSVEENGDVAPRWQIPVKDLTGQLPVGFALNPMHKEIMISSTGRSSDLHRPPSGIMQTVMTFSWPEIF